MKALLLAAPGVLEVADVPEPDVGPDDVLVRVKAAGICGSDIHGMDGSTGRRIPPLIMGHEAAGVIEAVGSSVSGWRPGDAVTFDSTIWCGECPFCVRGQVNLCDRRQVLGVSFGEYRRDGAFAELVVVPARILYAVPCRRVDGRGGLRGAPGGRRPRGLPRARSPRQGAVLVVGAGVIGLLVMSVLRAAGSERIVAVDLSPTRLERARAMGATDVIVATDDVGARIRELTDGRGVDVAFEAVGIGSTIALATASVVKGGTVVLIGNVSPSVELPLQWTVSREIVLVGSAASAGEYPRALELIASSPGRRREPRQRRGAAGRRRRVVRPAARARHGPAEGDPRALTPSRRSICSHMRKSPGPIGPGLFGAGASCLRSGRRSSARRRCS